MQVRKSWFRPWLDDPGPWLAWTFEDDEVMAIAALLKTSGDTTNRLLHQKYGANALLFGATEFVERLSQMPVEAESLFRSAVAITALDYYHAQATPPRAQPGGDTNPFNRKRWGELRRHLFERLQEVLPRFLPGSLLSRAVLVATADDSMPARDLERSVKRQFDEFGMFNRVDVDVDVPGSAVGGAAWLRAETTSALEMAKKSLASEQPILVEVIRDPASAPSSTQLVVAFRLDEAETGPVQLYCYDPAQGSRLVLFEIWIGSEETRIYDVDTEDEHAAPRGIRAIAVPAASPPLFGLRRHTRRFLPWAFFWSVRRRWQTLALRKRESKQPME